MTAEAEELDENQVRRERQLDDALAGTFPASDPVSIGSFAVRPVSQSLIKPATEPHYRHG